MDPDKDTVSSQPQLGRKELLRSEHQLLLLVERLLDKANYFQVSPPKQFSLPIMGYTESVTVILYEEIRMKSKSFSSCVIL